MQDHSIATEGGVVLRSRNAVLALCAATAALTTTTAATTTTTADAKDTADSATVDTPAIPKGHLGGLDVSSWQPRVDWPRARRLGARFAIVKATEGREYVNPYFTRQYRGARDVEMVRSAYHFALPHTSSGKAQADYFITHGGGWSQDGRTLPGALDIENNPYRNGLNVCYGLSAKAMVKWIRGFTARYLSRTGRRPLIYTNRPWWRSCTRNDRTLASNPLWLARWRTRRPHPLPGGWKKAAVWQYDNAGRFPGDQNAFRGTWKDLVSFASEADGPVPPTVPTAPAAPSPPSPPAAPAAPVPPVKPVPPLGPVPPSGPAPSGVPGPIGR